MTVWSQIISEGTMDFPSMESVEEKISQIESATEELTSFIGDICSAEGVNSLEKLIRLKAKGEDHKSPYEAINQLLHYWHCMIAGNRLLQLGCSDLKITGGAEDNNEVADVFARTNDGDEIIGEVFCVSKALWPAKNSKTIDKITKEHAGHKFILFNVDAKSVYKSKTGNIAFYGVNRAEKKIDLLCYSEDGQQVRPKVNLSGKY